MHLLEKLDQLSRDVSPAPTEKVLSHKLGDDLPKLAVFYSTRQMEKSSLYQALKPEIERLVFGYEHGHYSEEKTGSKQSFYRAVCWHLEHGKNFKGILETLRNRALVSRADIYFFPAVDIGMARSGNRNVVRDLALELGYNYFFSASYLHCGTFDQSHGQKKNRLGLEGNAVLSRHPLTNLRIISLKNACDPMKGPDRKIGCEKALLSDVVLPDNQKITIVCLNLPDKTHPSQRGRAVKHVLTQLRKENSGLPVLVAGDLKTSTYNVHDKVRFFLSLLNKKYRGFDYVVSEHHTHPERYFEKKLFQELRAHHFYAQHLNEEGKGTCHVRPSALLEGQNDPSHYELFVKKFFGLSDETLPFKYDWFFANGLIKRSESFQSEGAKVITHLFYDGRSVSCHDPILLDFEVQSPDMELSQRILRGFNL